MSGNFKNSENFRIISTVLDLYDYVTAFVNLVRAKTVRIHKLRHFAQICVVRNVQLHLPGSYHADAS